MVLIIIIAIILIVKLIVKQKYKELESEVLGKLGFSSWNIVSYFDAYVTVKSRQTLEKYDDIKFFKENKERLEQAEENISKKNDVVSTFSQFLENNDYKSRFLYKKIEKQIAEVLKNARAYRICVTYISSAGNKLGTKEIALRQYDIDRFKKNPSLLMSKSEYNKYLKEQQKEALGQKQHEFYERVNKVIDYANDNKDALIIKGSQEKLDILIAQLFDRTVNSIKKIKTIDSEEWDIIRDYIAQAEERTEEIV